MAALPYMQLYVADYLADTLYLDVVESGAYLHLLMNYWQTGKPLPDCDKKLARISKCTPEQWSNVRSTVVEYFVKQDGLLIHERVEKDLEKVRRKSKQASEAGKKSAAARSTKSKDLNGCSAPVDDSLNHTEADTETETETDNKKSTADAGFEKPEIKDITDSSSLKINQTLDDLCKELKIKNIFKEVYAFKNKMLKNGFNPKAILHTLSQCYTKGQATGFNGDTPWGYCQKIISVENGNYNEQDFKKTT